MEVTRHDEKSPVAPASKQDGPAAAVKAGAETATATDAKGRVIEVGRLNALQFYRITKALGSAGDSEATKEFAALVCTVRSIDGERIDFPTTERQIEALIQRLDFPGIAAIQVALTKITEADSAGTDAAKN
jgi:hypothetical protein